VITVPAYFNDSQRQATKDAGTIAGLEVKRIINEPTAARSPTAWTRRRGDQKIAVYDLGGGTFDISILEVGEGVHQFEVLATNGDTHLGGDDFDERIIDFTGRGVPKEQGIDLRKDPMALQRLKEACREGQDRAAPASRPTSTCRSSPPTRTGPKHLNVKLTRAKLEQLVEHLVERTIEAPAARRSKDAGVGPATSTRSCWSAARPACPRSRPWSKEIFGKDPHKGVNPDEVVAIGAAIQGGVLGGDVKDVLLLDVTPLSLASRPSAAS
jgi:molecular chaperone DnaK